MNFFEIMEIIFISNVALIFLPFQKLTRKLGSLLVLIVLIGCLFFVLRTDPDSIFILDYADKNFFWGAFTVDRLSAFFGALLCFLSFVCISLFGAKSYNQLTYYSVFFCLELFLFHTFVSVNMLTFYVLFETTLIPMFVLILLWGSRQRKLHAMYMFFFYTAIGSVLLLVALFVFYAMSGSVLITASTHIEPYITFFITLMWFCFFVGFSFKVPVAPLHTWLPEAHVEAPTVGSIVLAGLLLKIGTFGMLRFMFPGLNLLNFRFQDFVYAACVFSLFYASLVAIRQLDIKKIIAYSSVAHMGFVVIGLFSITFIGFVGSYFTMLSHGVVASALFFLVGVLYERYKSRILLNYGGLVSVMPVFAIIFFVFTLANIGFPFTSNFVGELFILIGVVSTNLLIGIICLFSIVLPPVYSLWLFNRVFFGGLGSGLTGFSDLNTTEFYLSALFISLTLLGGIAPKIITAYVELEYIKLLV